jgi:hypothetical protein
VREEVHRQSLFCLLKKKNEKVKRNKKKVLCLFDSIISLQIQLPIAASRLEEAGHVSAGEESRATRGGSGGRCSVAISGRVHGRVGVKSSGEARLGRGGGVGRDAGFALGDDGESRAIFIGRGVLAAAGGAR